MAGGLDEQIAHWIMHLRMEHRLKHCCDYAYVCKYGALQVLCHEAYQDTIARAAADYLGVAPTFHCWGQKEQP